MKKRTAFLLVCVLLLTSVIMTACGDNTDAPETSGAPDTAINTRAPAETEAETEVATEKETEKETEAETEAPETVIEGINYEASTSLNPGKEYVLTFDIGGEKYALTDNEGVITATKLPAEAFLDGVLNFAEDTDVSAYSWDVLYNKGDNPAKGYFFQNTKTENYLGYIDGAIVSSSELLGVELGSNSQSARFTNHVWNYEADGDAVSLYAYNDTAAYIGTDDGANVNTSAENISVYLYEKIDVDYPTWVLVNELESNEQYLIASSNEEGTALIFEAVVRDMYTEEVEIKKSSGGELYIEYEASYFDFPVWSTYSCGADRFFICTWNTPESGEVLRLGDSAPSITSSFGDPNYYFRFKYENNVLSAPAGLDGEMNVDNVDKILTFMGENMSTTGDGEVYFFKRVSGVE